MSTTVDVAMLHRGHEDLERLLLVLESHVARMLSNEQPDTRLMRRIVSAIAEYIDRVHGPRERAAFGALLKRLPWLGALIEEHAQQLEHLRATGRRLADALARGLAQDDALAFVAALRRHIVIEEAELLPAVEIMEACGPHDAQAERVEREKDDPEELRFHALFVELCRAAGCDGEND